MLAVIAVVKSSVWRNSATPPAALVANPVVLMGVGGPGQQQAGLGTRRPHHHPAPAAALVGVLDQVEAQLVDIEFDRLGIVADEERGERDVHPYGLRAPPPH